jgi:hypothetical protein
VKFDDPRLEGLLAAYRDETQPGHAAEQQMLRRFRGAVDRERRRSVLVVAGVVALAAAIVIAWLGGRWSSGVAVGVAPRAPEATFEVTGPGTQRANIAAPTPAELPAAVDPTPPPVTEVEAEIDTPTRSTSTPWIHTDAAPDTAADDGVRLIAQAEASLRDGDANGALALLEEHARLHPDASTVEERRALQVLGWCAAGRLVEGRGARWSFLRDFPRSAYRPRVEAACAR